MPVANDGRIAPINPTNPVFFNAPRVDWWDMVSLQLGNKVADMLKESLYKQPISPFTQDRNIQNDIVRFTLENEIRHAQLQQIAFDDELTTQDKQIKMALIQAKSDMFLEEKAQKEAQEQAELKALERSQSPLDEEMQTGDEQAQEKAEDIGKPKGKDGEVLSDSEIQLVKELKIIDTNVKNHESAHLSVGGSLVRGGASYSYTEGPDGVLYATAGEVSIDTSETGDAKKDIDKARQIQAAALAPSDPSPQDYRVAASAAMMEMKAQMRLSEEFTEELKKNQGVKIYKENMNNLQKVQMSPPAFGIVA